MSEIQELFLGLTDYVPAEYLTLLSAEILQELVCGETGNQLEQIRLDSGCSSVRFVVQPRPGFQLTGVSDDQIFKGRGFIEQVMESIKIAALSEAANMGIAPPPSSSTKKTNARRVSKQQHSSKNKLSKRYFNSSCTKNLYYHPLYSNPLTSDSSQLLPAALGSLSPILTHSSPTASIIPGIALLPTPSLSSGCLDTDNEQDSNDRRVNTAELYSPFYGYKARTLTDAECRDLIQSPYLSYALKSSKKLLTPLIPTSKVVNQIPVDAVVSSDTPQMNISSSPVLTKQSLDFEKEIAAFLPGVPGARTTKEYKSIRRKISEIDKLLAETPDSMDVCQSRKVAKRALYVSMIIRLLQGLPSSDDPDGIMAASPVSNILTEKQDEQQHLLGSFDLGASAAGGISSTDAPSSDASTPKRQPSSDTTPCHCCTDEEFVLVEHSMSHQKNRQTDDMSVAEVTTPETSGSSSDAMVNRSSPLDSDSDQPAATTDYLPTNRMKSSTTPMDYDSFASHLLTSLYGGLSQCFRKSHVVLLSLVMVWAADLIKPESFFE